MDRRSFLKLLPGLLPPLVKVGWPHISTTMERLQQRPDAPNILFLIFDTLSARQMSLHGYNRETTPNLARFAERATVFHRHHASGNFTSPGTASILTGTYPWAHRAFHLHGIVDATFIDKSIFTLLPDYYYKVAYTHNLLVTSLLHQFRSNVDLLKQTRELCLFDGQFADRVFFEDYSVAFWSEWLFLRGGKSPPGSMFLSVVDRGSRFANKSSVTQKYGHLFPRGIPNLHSLLFILEDAIDWIQEEVTTISQPFFAYFHLLPPHEPYTTRRDFVDVFKDNWQPTEKEPHFASEGHNQNFLNEQRRMYDEYLAYTDSEFGRLYDSLERNGLLDNTYLVVTSDHGELFERGIRGHVTPAMYEPLLNVPLLISKPGQRQRVDVHARTSCVDLLPTFLRATGQPIPDWCEGDILPTFDANEVNTDRSIFALEAKSNPKQAPLSKATVTIAKGEYKLIHYLGSKNRHDEYELYNLAHDPEELENLYTYAKSVATDLQSELELKLQRVNAPYQRQ